MNLMQEHLWEEMKTMQQLIEEITKAQLRTDLPSFRPGDTVRRSEERRVG